MGIVSAMLVGVALVLFLVANTNGNSANHTTNNADRFNEFDWQLSKALGASIKNNVVISPISVKLVLAMLYEGSGGATAKELEEVLKIEKGPAPSQRFSHILQSLQGSSSGYELDVGMKLFIDKEAVPKKSFEKKIFDLYNATIDSINFKNTSAAVAQINGWARSVTKGHIQNLLSEADAHHSTLMLLLNAVYFKGLWQYPFAVNATKEGTFFTEQNEQVTVEYMSGVQTLSYFDSVEFKSSIVRLPYEGGKFAMYIILPDKGTTLDEVIDNLTPTKVRFCLSEMMQVSVYITIPKFNFEFASSLAPVLKELGIKEIFSNKADLRNIAEGPRDPVVSNVIQKASIEVSELGTVAAVATAVELVNKFGMNNVNFNATRPFLFFIEDETTNTVVFVGKVVNPVAPGKPIVSASNSAPNPALQQKIPSHSSSKPEVSTPSNGSSNNGIVLLSAPTSAQRVPVQNDNNPFYYFDIQLLQALHRKEKDNWVISPSSIKSTLGLLLEGASKTTALEICQILRLPLDVNAARTAMQRYQIGSQISSDGVTVKTGTSMLVKQGLGINNRFRTNALSYYSAPIKVSDFTNPDMVAREVNKWMKELTDGFIPETISPDSISPGSIMLVVNGVYFKGDWKFEFKTSDTRTACFYAPECTKVKMMTINGPFKFGEMQQLNARIIELPYKDERYSMVIVLPHQKTGLLRTSWDLPFNSINNFLDSILPSDIELVMPKFSTEYTIDLSSILESYGVSEMFSSDADFSDLFHPGTKAKISALVHRAKVEVNEKGTIASAATVAQFQLLSNSNKPQFYVDRPFFFFVRDKEAGFLFEGQITNILAAQTQARKF